MSIFDKYDLEDVNEGFPIPENPKKGLTLIIGSSGSGKSTILNDWGLSEMPINDSSPIISLFESEEVGETLLISSGLRSIPCWKRSLKEVSNGERHRAEIAVSLAKENIVIDEFTSVVDRDTARALCESINKHAKKTGKNIVLATCHRDVLEWLDFDSAYDTDDKSWIDRRLVRRNSELKINIKPCDPEKIWPIFKRYHYLSGKINKACNCWGVYYQGKVIAMTSVIAFPSGNWSNGWREHRTVVLPEFQGIGIGSSISDAVAKMIVDSGGRFFSKTAHPALGEHRQRSLLWKPTSKNKVIRSDYNSSRKTKEDGHKMKHAKRSCYSHEYIGE